MDQAEFMEALVSVVYKGGARNVLETLRDVPGSAPQDELRALSEWYKALDPSDQKMVSALISLTLDEALFGLFACLDGVRSLSSGGTPRIELLVDGQNIAEDQDLLTTYRAAQPNP